MDKYVYTGDDDILAGEKEISDRSLTIRSRKKGDLGTYELNNIVDMINQAVVDNVELHEMNGIAIPVVDASTASE